MYTMIISGVGVIMFVSSFLGLLFIISREMQRQKRLKGLKAIECPYPQDYMNSIVDDFMIANDEWKQPFDDDIDVYSERDINIVKFNLQHANQHIRQLKDRLLMYPEQVSKLQDRINKMNDEVHTLRDKNYQLTETSEEQSMALSKVIELYHHNRDLVPEEEKFKVRAKENLLKATGELRLSDCPTYGLQLNKPNLPRPPKEVKPINIGGKLYV